MKRIWFWILALLCIAPFIIAAVGVAFLPDQIPVHYNIMGEVDRWGSKYEQYIMAIFFSLAGWILLLVGIFGDRMADTEEELAKARANQKVIVIVGIVTQLFLCALQIVLVVAAFRGASSETTTLSVPLYKIVGIGMGILFVVIGNIMPKAKPNNLVGMRTPWSYSSEEAWAKSQRICGITFAAAGAVCIMLSILLEGFILFWVVMGCSIGAAIVACVLSYIAAKATGNL